MFLLSLAVFGLFWAALAAVKADPTVLPGPVDVARVFWSEAASGRLPKNLLATLLRVSISFGFAMAAGCLLAFFLGRYRMLGRGGS